MSLIRRLRMSWSLLRIAFACAVLAFVFFVVGLVGQEHGITVLEEVGGVGLGLAILAGFFAVGAGMVRVVRRTLHPPED